MENDTGMMILGIAVFIVFGGLIGWVIYRHIKYTIAGAKAQAEVLKQAVGQAKEEIRIANERKKNGEGWTLPPEVVEKRSGTMANEEIVFGYTEEQIESDQKEHAKKNAIAGIVLLVFAGLCVLAGLLFGNDSKKVAAYPTTQAEVLKCEAVLTTDDDGDEYVDYYRVDIRYAVDGQAYTETGKRSESRLKGVITVHYNPGKPEKVYFEAYAQGEGNAFWYAIGGIVGALGLWIVLSERKKMRKLKEGQ